MKPVTTSAEGASEFIDAIAPVPKPHRTVPTVDQLAEQLGVTVRHIRRLVAERRVPHLKVGQLVRFDPAEVAQWLDEARHPQLQVANRGRRLNPQPVGR